MDCDLIHAHRELKLQLQAAACFLPVGYAYDKRNKVYKKTNEILESEKIYKQQLEQRKAELAAAKANSQ
jgi:hypothetical protein